MEGGWKTRHVLFILFCLENEGCVSSSWQRCSINMYLAFILRTMWWAEQESYLPIGALLWSLIYQSGGSCTSLEYKHCLPECSLYEMVQYFTDRFIDEAVHSDGLNFCRIVSLPLLYIFLYTCILLPWGVKIKNFCLINMWGVFHLES